MKKHNYLVLCLLLQPTITPASQELPRVIEAARNGDQKTLEECLAHGQNCAEKDEHGNTALHAAAERGDEKLIMLLTSYNDNQSYFSWSYWWSAPTLPSIDDVNKNGETALHRAIEKGHFKVAEQLLKKYANKEIPDKHHMSPAFLAVSKDDPRFLQLLVAHGLNPQNHKRQGNTILHDAIIQNKPNSIAHLIENIPTLITVKNSNQETAVSLAIDSENIPALKCLKQSIYFDATIHNGLKHIHHATIHNKFAAVDFLLKNNIAIDTPDEEGNTPLLYATAYKNDAMMRYLLERKAKLDKRNKAGEDAFAIAARYKNYAGITFLAQLPGVDIDTRNNDGLTPFAQATIAQDRELMKTLKNLGANIRLTDNKRENVLHKTARSGDIKTAQLVLSYDKSFLDERNHDGQTPITLAVQHKQGSALLMLLIENRVNINTLDNAGNSPVHHAAAHDNIDAIRILTQHGAYVEQRALNGNSIAHIAAEKGSIQTLHYCMNNYPQMFLDYNAHNATPFITAVKHGQLPATQLLLNKNESYFINGDVQRSLELIKHEPSHHHRKVYEFLATQHNERVAECNSIHSVYKEVNNLIGENQRSFQHAGYVPSSLQHATLEQIYKMPQQKRAALYARYLEYKDKENNAKIFFEKQFAEQKKEEDHWAEKKRQKDQEDAAELERQKRHDAALMGQHVPKPSAPVEKPAVTLQKPQTITPPMGVVENKCHSCQKNFSSKSLPCSQCKKITNTCSDCVKKLNGKCVTCSGVAAQPPAEQQAEQICCINGNGCTEEQGVFQVPCINKHPDLICKQCLAQINICPFCREVLPKK